MVAGGLVNPKQDDSDWNFQTYKGSNLSYEISCEPKSSDDEYKEGDNLSGNLPINPKNITTNTDNFLIF